MKKILLTLSVVLISMSAHADLRETLTNLIRQTKTEQSADKHDTFKLSQHKQDSIVNSISSQYAKGKISADSVISLALYHKAGSPEVAERCLKPIASAGNRRAITELGSLYALTPQFKSKASEGIKLLQSAANAGDNDAYAYLGLYYYTHNDFKKAKSCFDKCQPMSFGFGNTALGGMYLQGRGVKEDIPLAREYFHKAALQGYPRGASLYGHNLRVNGGGPANLPESFFWIYIASDLGDDLARATLGQKLSGENLGEGEEAEDAELALSLIATANTQHLTKDPIYKDGFLAGLKAKEAAAENGDDWARFYLGSMNFNGDFLNQNYTQALRYYLPIASNGKLPRTLLALVNSRLAYMYKNGKGTKADKTKAHRYATSAARYGSIGAYKMVEQF